MQESVMTTVGLPLALAFIMLGLGLHLTMLDFKRILVQPKAIIIGLFAQVILLPAICFLIAHSFGLPPALVVGMVLLAASPGGVTANLYSHLFKGDVALNISLTAINSVLAIVSIPFLVNLALSHFMGGEQYIPLQFKKTLEVIVLILFPVLIGMVLNAKFPRFARAMDKPVKIASAFILALLVALIIYKERANIVHYIELSGIPVLLFNLFSLLLGYWVGKMGGLKENQNRAIAFEVGIHNNTLAIYLALVVLKNSEMSIPAAIYSLIMFLTAAAFGWYLNRKPQTLFN